jgi:hypothetical protein
VKPARAGELNFIMMALRGKKIGFEKVIKMVDEMVVTLKKEQTDDNDKKEYCDVQLDHLDDKKKTLEREVSDSEKAIADAEEAIDTLTADLKALAKAIKALDKSVTGAVEQRHEENEDYKSLLASDSAAKELLEFAKNRLNKFYNPALYAPPPKRELSEEDRIVVNNGGTAPPTPAPGGIAGTGIAFADVSDTDAPAAPPQAVGAYKTKSEESSGVIAMVDLLIKDLDKELTEAGTAEKDAQADYETFMKDAATQRATDTKTLADKESAKADAEGMLQQHTDSKKSATAELMATVHVIGNLHNECDWLLQYFDARTEARSAEIDALIKAKAVLSGADFSLLQVASKARCGPQTQVCVAGSKDAASNKVWECAPASDGAAVDIGNFASENGAMICGPGTFHFSPMTCAGGRFEYKKQVVERSTASSTGGMQCPDGGQSVDFPYAMSCYMVEC